MLPPLVKISNKTKGVTWVYNPVVFCQPLVDEDVVWSVVYMDDGEVKREEKRERMKGELDVIGGDLSLFEVTKGGYYLCRIVLVIITLVIDSRRWRPSSQPVSAVYPEVNAFQNPNRRKNEVELGVSFNSESEIEKIGKAVSSLVGVESVSTH
ncbi:hypothetical protein QVD17_03244 [Tagetes erecta]|uniref:Uncharacterized protein n=1 Tax=Tagetes erecta TaxID=13708 RepID=A0AAD8LD54_TARER|nr:hypothetical protein QVD17_03244 [Tagetes erecta]